MTGAEPPVVLAVDSGGSGLRAVLARGTEVLGEPVVSGEPVRTGARGIDAGQLLERLLPMARSLLDTAGLDRPAAVALGATGFATLGEELRAELPSALARELGVRRVALAADAVTAYTGALGARPGVVIAAGTGLIAIGTDLTAWRRADGWGHLLGDCGGGAWIGRAGLEAALRAHDGRTGGSAPLLARAETVFGPMEGLPGRLYPRPDRPAVLASFAPEVAACAGDDPVAADLLRAAARHMADAAAAVCPAPDPAPASGSASGAGGEPRVALTGGLFKLGDPLVGPLEAELAQRLPYARRVPAEGDPLTGAVRIAAALAADRLGLPYDERMLYVMAEK
ncbi:ATPase [Streptomyces phaeolivaceus]|uniref:ATPase n=1 Tax=Streptomyces phaeolivaceus TaxID=2653200 RepID=A0A5P8JXN2_9ACTN|nr:BadF/BadG/BcrA/BcrD ATPase family protein [Streptomyces phaeolivaceus]QFQ95450.1 ATPase [Streptomyces phaeolivaceus]